MTAKKPPRVSRVVCFGEVMLRLTAPDRELLLQSPRFSASVGGAEANVAVSLSHLGEEAALVTVLPDTALGHAVLETIRGHGVDTSAVHFGKGRLGVYFVTQGAGVRATEVHYDRTHSAFAEAAPDLVDWNRALAGAARLHLSGVTPAIGRGGAAAAIRAAEEASRLGVRLSFDGNYRATLWSQWQGDAPAILRSILAHADIAFIDTRDIALILATSFDAGDEQTRGRLAARAAFAAFPKLTRIACTQRRRIAGDRVELAASLYTRAGETHTPALALGEIVDRIGAGDAFAAGLLHALGRGLGEVEALEFALAAGAYKHTVPGDFNPATEVELRRILREAHTDVRR